MRRLLIALTLATIVGAAVPFARAQWLLNSGSAVGVSSCGTGPSVSGGDSFGTITVGSGTVTSCQLDFSHTYATAPSCVASSDVAAGPRAAPTTSAVVFTASLTGGKVFYICFMPGAF